MNRSRLRSFTLPTRLDEDEFLFRKDRKQDMACYDTTNVYPFNIFPAKELSELEFGPVTVLYGGNGSGKSTLLNVIAEKLGLARRALFNRTPSFADYLRFCRYEISGSGKLPPDSRIITSDDVFDSLLDHRAFNEGVENRREELFEEWSEMMTRHARTGESFRLSSLEDLDELSRHNRARSKTRSAYTQDNLRVHEIRGASNGESAFRYFVEHIADGSLTLLDEPENSLSAALQEQLAGHLADSARFYDVQLVIATHSPFMLAIPGARVYDLDSVPVCERPWTDLPNVRVWHDFFKAHEREFDS
ncbi:MAG: AAA family ATPase [Clostridia bacterium]|nr:AAA family ATPase [Clostridia bacterium]